MCGFSLWSEASVLVSPDPGSLIIFPLLVLILSVVPRSREGGGGRRTFFASFLYKPVRARRSYKTKTYHARKRFVTALLMFNIVSNSSVSWAGTLDQASKEGNGPWRLISTPKSEFLEKIRRIKIFYAQFIFICAVFNYNPAFPTKSANLGRTMHISLASSRDRADYHAHATISMRTSPRSNHE